MKLKKNSKYFVADPKHVQFGKRIPLVCFYRGHCDNHPKNHLFIIGSDGNYCLSDKQVSQLVEPFTKKREAEVNAEADYFNEHGRLMARSRSDKRKTSEEPHEC